MVLGSVIFEIDPGMVPTKLCQKFGEGHGCAVGG